MKILVLVINRQAILVIIIMLAAFTLSVSISFLITNATTLSSQNS